MRAEITTSCKSVNTRYTRLNLLGWAMLCPHAIELLWHGSTPLTQPSYSTADESKELHDRLRDIVDNVLKSMNTGIISREVEYKLNIGFLKDDELLCARSKADLLYTIKHGKDLMNLYIDVSSTRINVAKPWQVLLRGIAMYYEWRLPVGIIIVSPEKIRYKLLEDEDQKKILRRINKKLENLEPHPNLCSLCELVDYCPHKAI